MGEKSVKGGLDGAIINGPNEGGSGERNGPNEGVNSSNRGARVSATCNLLLRVLWVDSVAGMFLIGFGFEGAGLGIGAGAAKTPIIK